MDILKIASTYYKACIATDLTPNTVKQYVFNMFDVADRNSVQIDVQCQHTDIVTCYINIVCTNESRRDSILRYTNSIKAQLHQVWPNAQFIVTIK